MFFNGRLFFGSRITGTSSEFEVVQCPRSYCSIKVVTVNCGWYYSLTYLLTRRLVWLAHVTSLLFCVYIMAKCLLLQVG